MLPNDGSPSHVRLHQPARGLAKTQPLPPIIEFMPKTPSPLASQHLSPTPAQASPPTPQSPRRFWKMHGLGNDFVILETSEVLPVDLVRRIADRRRGVGADQVLTISSTDPEGSRPGFSYRVYNADGSPAEQCGNGLRCLARWVIEQGRAPGRELWFTGPGGLVRALVHDFTAIELELPPPVLDPDRIPFRANRRAREYEVDVKGMRLTVGVVNTGNPHAVLRVNDVNNWPVAKLGPEIEHHGLFPEGTNVEFMQVLTSRHVRLRVHERGTGETLACGSGSCAAVVWGRIMNWLDDDMIRVDLPGGTLLVRWQGEGHPLHLWGPAEHVYEGVLS